MKFLLTSAFFCFAVISCYGQSSEPAYDSTLAAKLGGDEHGMKMYVFVILKTGSNNVKDSATRAKLFAGHMANINSLVDSGKMVIAGPMGKNDKAYRGIFILNTNSIDEARSWVNRDAAVAANLFEAEYYTWYGSAAISEYIPYHKKIEKKGTR